MKRTALAIILIMLIITLPLTSAKGVSKPVQRDVFIYQYFSQVLIRFEYSLRYATMNNTYSVELANMTLGELREIDQEAIYYQGKGVNSTVMEVIPPFYSFAEELLTLTNLTMKFQRKPSGDLVAGIRGTIYKMEDQLAEIGQLRLRNGTEILTFNTQGVEEQLNDISKMVSKFHVREGFKIGVSDQSPILRQNITIFGSSPWNDTVVITIKGNNETTLLDVTPSKGGLFAKTYSFTKPGNYTVYAAHGANRSNVVKVMVKRIPTFFLSSGTYTALIGHNITLRGIIVDYYGNRLSNRTIMINNETELTNATGGFSKEYFSQNATELTVVLLFKGDKEHAPTTKTVNVVFAKYPVTITLTGPSQVTTGETANFTGKVNLPGRTNLTVYVNGEKNSTVTAHNGTFSFSFTPGKKGNLNVYVAFNGNGKYAKAVSNVVSVNVVPPENMTMRYIEVVLLGLLLVGVVLVGRRRGEQTVRKEGEVTIEPAEDATTEKTTRIPEDVGEAYTLLRSALSRKLGVSESLTPRETLEVLNGWGYYPELERATMLHEKAVYGGIPLTEEETEEFKKAVKTILGGLEG